MNIPQSIKRAIKIDLAEHIANNPVISLPERCDILHLLNAGYICSSGRIYMINNVRLPFRDICIRLYAKAKYREYFDEICTKIINSKTPAYLRKDGGGVIIPPIAIKPTKEVSVLTAIKKQPLPNPVNTHNILELPKMIAPVKMTAAVKTPKNPGTAKDKKNILVYGNKDKIKILQSIFADHLFSCTDIMDYANIILIESVDEYFNIPQGYNKKFIRFLIADEPPEKANLNEIIINYDFTANRLISISDKILI